MDRTHTEMTYAALGCAVCTMVLDEGKPWSSAIFSCLVVTCCRSGDMRGGDGQQKSLDIPCSGDGGAPDSHAYNGTGDNPVKGGGEWCNNVSDG